MGAENLTKNAFSLLGEPQFQDLETVLAMADVLDKPEMEFAAFDIQKEIDALDMEALDEFQYKTDVASEQLEKLAQTMSGQSDEDLVKFASIYEAWYNAIDEMFLDGHAVKSLQALPNPNAPKEGEHLKADPKEDTQKTQEKLKTTKPGILKRIWEAIKAFFSRWFTSLGRTKGSIDKLEETLNALKTKINLIPTEVTMSPADAFLLDQTALKQAMNVFGLLQTTITDMTKLKPSEKEMKGKSAQDYFVSLVNPLFDHFKSAGKLVPAPEAKKIYGARAEKGDGVSQTYVVVVPNGKENLFMIMGLGSVQGTSSMAKVMPAEFKGEDIKVNFRDYKGAMDMANKSIDVAIKASAMLKEGRAATLAKGTDYVQNFVNTILSNTLNVMAKCAVKGFENIALVNARMLKEGLKNSTKTAKADAKKEG